MKVRLHRIWKVVPVPLVTLTSMPGRLVGLCLGPMILVREDYAGDWPTIVHELTHCRQFWRGLAIVHLVRYYASRDYRLRAELEAFRAELAACDPVERTQRLRDSARALASSYSLDIEIETCAALLSQAEPAHRRATRHRLGETRVEPGRLGGLPARSATRAFAEPRAGRRR